MDLSVASLFGYRNGKIPISDKAWLKLEQAESAFRTPAETLKNAESSTYANQCIDPLSVNLLMEEPSHYPSPGKLTIEQRLERLEKAVEAFLLYQPPSEK